MGFLAALVIPSFTNFQQDQDLKLTAEEMKSNIRLAQSRSLSGSKGTVCNSDPLKPTILLGWYFAVQPGANKNTYSIAGVCKQTKSPYSVTQFNEEIKTTKNSKVTITSVSGFGSGSQIFGLFAPVSGKISYYTGGNFVFAIIPILSTEITLTNSSISDPSNNTQKVVITPSGDVYVTK